MSLNRDKANTVKVLPEGIDIFHDDGRDITLAHINHLTSRASGSLGAPSPAPGVVKMALERQGSVKCVTIPDELSMQTVGRFAEDHKFLVELACSTTLAPAYKADLFSKLVSPRSTNPGEKLTVVFVVCSGSKISMDEMVEYDRLVKADLQEHSGR